MKEYVEGWKVKLVRRAPGVPARRSDFALQPLELKHAFYAMLSSEGPEVFQKYNPEAIMQADDELWTKGKDPSNMNEHYLRYFMFFHEANSPEMEAKKAEVEAFVSRVNNQQPPDLSSRVEALISAIPGYIRYTVPTIIA